MMIWMDFMSILFFCCMDNCLDKIKLSRDWIKLIAIVFMGLNHIAFVFELPSALEFIFTTLGYSTFPVMCYFLVTGHEYTHSRARYILRLLAFSFISQLPFHLAFYKEAPIFGCPLNIFFTLALCFLMLSALKSKMNAALKLLSILGLYFLLLFTDWGYVAPVFILSFNYSYKERKKLTYSFLLLPLFIFLCQMLVGGSILYGVQFAIGALIASLMILVLYDEKKSGRSRVALKWFFYLFYPVHLMIIYLIKCFL